MAPNKKIHGDTPKPFENHSPELGALTIAPSQLDPLGEKMAESLHTLLHVDDSLNYILDLLYSISDQITQNNCSAITSPTLK